MVKWDSHSETLKGLVIIGFPAHEKNILISRIASLFAGFVTGVARSDKWLMIARSEKLPHEISYSCFRKNWLKNESSCPHWIYYNFLWTFQVVHTHNSRRPGILTPLILPPFWSHLDHDECFSSHLATHHSSTSSYCSSIRKSEKWRTKLHLEFLGRDEQLQKLSKNRLNHLLRTHRLLLLHWRGRIL